MLWHGQINWEQMVFLGNPEYGCDLQPIDFATVARGFGFNAWSVDGQTIEQGPGANGRGVAKCRNGRRNGLQHATRNTFGRWGLRSFGSDCVACRRPFA
jgi:hypothetical protein